MGRSRMSGVSSKKVGQPGEKVSFVYMSHKELISLTMTLWISQMTKIVLKGEYYHAKVLSVEGVEQWQRKALGIYWQVVHWAVNLQY